MKRLFSALLIVLWFSVTPAMASWTFARVDCASPQDYLTHNLSTILTIIGFGLHYMGPNDTASATAKVSFPRVGLSGELFGLTLGLGFSPQSSLNAVLGLFCHGIIQQDDAP